MTLKTFFSPSYLFSLNGAVPTPGEKLFLIAGIVLILLSVVLKVSAVLAVNPVDKTVRQKFYKLFLTIGILELLWFFCRYENAMFFGTPFVSWLIVLIGLVWLGFLFKKIFMSYGSQKGAWEKEQVKLKYLPK